MANPDHTRVDLLAELRTFFGLVAAVVAGLFLLDQSWQRPLAQAVDAVMFNIVVTACLAGTAQLLFKLDETRQPRPTLLRTAGVGVVSVLLGGEIAVRLASALWGDDPAAIRVTIFTVGGLIMAVVQVSALATDRSRLSQEVARLAAVDAELAHLRARLRPHFLFNSLNSIASLIAIDPEEAERAVEDLSVLLRYELHSTRRPTVQLEEELEAVRAYLALQHRRFEHRLRWEIEVERELQHLRVPPMLLQPLVDNAVVHAVARETRPVHVSVRIVLREDELELVVEDDGPGSSTHEGNGTALVDLSRRLQLMLPPGSLEAGPREGGGFSARVLLPIEEETT